MELQILKQEMKIRGFSNRTSKCYLYHNEKFLSYIKKSARDVTNFDIRNYLEYLKDKGLTNNSLCLVHSALKFYYNDVLRRRFFIHLKRAKREKTLPTILTQQEISQLFSVLKNKKHLLMIKLLYASGLRVSELVNLKVNDIDFNQRLIYVKQGKGNKDRITLLSGSVINELMNYLATREHQNEYIFNNKEKKLSIRTVQQVMKHALKSANINKDATVHSLRACFATHLLEGGVELSKIQKLLGHSKPETTQFYLKISTNQLVNVKSPLDNLEVRENINMISHKKLQLMDAEIN